ncbi:MAG: hypothetical protein JNM27_10990 [Leptospirales bacterium]|nr:hypothetical protein [Leptospirales bacterium]
MNRFLVIIVFFAFPLFAETRPDMRGDATVDDVSRYVDVRLDLDRILYSPGQDIPVRYRVTNRGYRIFRLFPNEDARRSFQFLVEDKAGHEITPIEKPRTMRREDGGKPVRDLVGNAVKEIILHPGETFEKTIYLNDLYDFKPGEEYRVCAYFKPESDSEAVVRSRGWTRLRLERVKQAPLAESQDVVGDPGQGLSPEETVYLFLSAELKKNWSHYLKHLDLTRYITSYDRYALQFAGASDLERPDIIRKFSTYLTTRPSDQLKRFRITRTDYEKDRDGELATRGNAKVTVQADRDSDGFQVRYEYVFTLVRAEQPGFWKIVHVSARVMRQGQN